MQLLKIIFCIVFSVLFQTYAQRVRYPTYGRPQWMQNEVNDCPGGRTCRAWNRCPPSRRPRRTQQNACIYPNYSRRIPGVCCLDRRDLSPIQPIPEITPRPMMPEPVPVTRRPLSANPPGPDSVPDGPPCGLSQTTSAMVIGGSSARQGVWPWLVALTVNTRGIQQPTCTGFLIDRRHFISAAHCFDDRNPSSYRARIGNVDRNLAEEYGVENIAIPDGYVPGLFYDDIAVLTLDRDVTTPDYMPVCLPNDTFQNLTGRGVTVAGWGATRVGGPMTAILQQLHAIPVVSTYRCNQILRDAMSSYTRQFPRGVTETFICAGFPAGEGDSCGGDSGGPLMLPNPENGQWYAVGVVSFGISCALPGIPGGYTRISSYLGFIRRNT